MSLSDLQSIITITAILIAGIWTLYRFGLSREQYPKLQFDLNLNQLGTSRDKQVVELVATITNKGIARQYIKGFRFNVLTFDDNTPFDLTDAKIEKRLKFNKLNKGTEDSKGELSWIDSHYPVFVDGGISREFRYVTALDKNVRFVMIYSKFDHEEKRWFYKDRSEHYRLSKTFAIN